MLCDYIKISSHWGSKYSVVFGARIVVFLGWGGGGGTSDIASGFSVSALLTFWAEISLF